MALDDILKAGKSEEGANKLSQAYAKNPTINPIPDLVEIDGGKEIADEFGEEAFLSLQPAQINHLLRNLHEEKQRKLVEKVRGDYNSVLKELNDFAGLALQIKPLNYDGVDEDIKGKHENLVEAFTYLQNPQQGIAKLSEEYYKLIREDDGDEKKGRTLARAALMLLESNPSMGERALNVRASKAQNDLKEALRDENVARAYFKGIYDNAADERKRDSMAYAFGRYLYSVKSREEE